MLRFLLDEHISSAVCSIVRRRQREVAIESLLEWQAGGLRRKDDDVLLKAAADAGLVLVTCDLRTIPALLQPQDFGGIAEGLIGIWDAPPSRTPSAARRHRKLYTSDSR